MLICSVIIHRWNFRERGTKNNSEDSSDVKKANTVKSADKTVLRRINKNERLLKGFAIQENFNSLVSTTFDKNSILCLNGFRALGATLIIMTHVAIYGSSSTDNLQSSYRYNDDAMLQPTFFTSLAVDIFFVLSGFLLAYNTREQQKKLKTSSTVKKIIARYFRVNASFMLVGILNSYCNHY